MNQFLEKKPMIFKKEISCLHYISQGKDGQEHLKNIERVLQAGGNWIQLRLKETSAKEVLETAISAREICSAYQAKLIINDHVEIAKTCNADGVLPDVLLILTGLVEAFICGCASTSSMRQFTALVLPLGSVATSK